MHMRLDRIFHRSSIQTEQSQPEGTRIMPETRLTRFRHYPLTRGLEFLGLHRRPMPDYFLTYDGKNRNFKKNLLQSRGMMANSELVVSR